jgi:hypothetical protein
MTKNSVSIFHQFLVYFLISILLVILLGFMALIVYGLLLGMGPIKFAIAVAVIILILLSISGKVTLPRRVSMVGAYIAGVAFLAFQGLSIILILLLGLPFILFENGLGYLFKAPLRLKVHRMVGRNDINGLILALEDKDWGLRDEAAKALRKIGGKRAIEPLARFDAEVEAQEAAYFYRSRPGGLGVFPWY